MSCSTCGSPCTSCNPCGGGCDGGNCITPCLQWGFDDCYLRGRCADGSELNPLNLCDWLIHHETPTEMRLVPNGEECSYIEFSNELSVNFPEEYPPMRICVCDLLSLAKIECLQNVYDKEAEEGVEPDHCSLFVYYNQEGDDCNERMNHKWHAYSIPLVTEDNHAEAPRDFDGHYKVLTLNEAGCIEERYIDKKINFYANVVQFTARPGDPDDNNIYWQNLGADEYIDLRPTTGHTSPFSTDEKDPNWVAPVDMVCFVSFCTNVHADKAGFIEVDTSAFPSNMPWNNEVELFNSAHPTWQATANSWNASHSTLQIKVPKGSYGRLYTKSSQSLTTGKYRIHCVRCTYIPAEIGF